MEFTGEFGDLRGVRAGNLELEVLSVWKTSAYTWTERGGLFACAACIKRLDREVGASDRELLV